jgi:hypothetical protein
MTNNPLQQYFRRPAIYIKLPSQNKYYDQSVIEPTQTGELPVYPMTALDEITSKTPDAVFNGHAVVDIIHSCMPNIKNAWEINSVDLDAILIAIKVASTGEKMEIGTVCPNCSTDATYDISLIQVLSQQQNVDYEKTLKIRELEIKFKPLSFAEANKNNLAQFELQKFLRDSQSYEDSPEKEQTIRDTITKLNSLFSEIISGTVEYIKTPESTVHEREFINEFMNNCDRNTNLAIREFSVQLRNENQLKPLNIKCMHCSHEYTQQLILNITDFFA